MLDYTIVDSNTPIEFFSDFLSVAEHDDSPAAVNMVMTDWENRPNSFLYKLYIEKIYDKANRGIYLLHHLNDSSVISGTGLSSWDMDNNVSLFFSRSYVVPKHRGTAPHRFGKNVWLLHEYAKKYNYKAAVITVNDYNKRYVSTTNKLNTTEKDYTVIDGEYYTKSGRKFLKTDLYPAQVLINFTPQWIVYHMLDEHYENVLLNTLQKLEVPNQ